VWKSTSSGDCDSVGVCAGMDAPRSWLQWRKTPAESQSPDGVYRHALAFWAVSYQVGHVAPSQRNFFLQVGVHDATYPKLSSYWSCADEPTKLCPSCLSVRLSNICKWVCLFF
jgi:hypothetical protein